MKSTTAVPPRRRIANRSTRMSRFKDLPLPLTTTGAPDTGPDHE
ncbi:hypothetical protein [Stackebrandtia albiflava]|nr:hypothetical protein [Stackebrandtia albiflava]